MGAMSTVTPTTTGPPGTLQKRDRARGLLVGVHTGDSLGATHEFLAPGGDTLPSHLNVTGGGLFGWAPGAPTDDTELTWAVATGYRRAIEHKRQLLPTVYAEMCRWANGPWEGRRGLPRDIGGATMRALVRFDPDPDTQANGSLMRCAPGVLAGTVDEAIAISQLTHPNTICSASVAAYVTAAKSLIDGEDAYTAVRRGAEAAFFDEQTYDAIIETLEARHPSDVYLIGAGSGEVVDSLVLALAAVRTATSFEDGLDHVIRWVGKDADTNGAIAGGLLGARFGLSGIPKRWVKRLRFGPRLVRWADWTATL